MSGEGIGWLIAAPLMVAAVGAVGAVMAVGGLAYGAIKVGAFLADYAIDKSVERSATRGTDSYRRIVNATTPVKPLVTSGGKVNRSMPTVTANSVTTPATFTYNSAVNLDSLNTKLDQITADKQKEIVMLFEVEAAKMQQEMSALEDFEIKEYISNIGQTRASFVSGIERVFDKVESEGVAETTKMFASYQDECHKSMASLQDEINDYLNECADKKQAEQELSSSCIEEARQLIKDVEEIFEAAVDTARLSVIKDTFNDALDMHNAGNYQASIAAMQTLKMQIAEQVYDMERKTQLWDMAYRIARAAAEQVKSYLESQQGFTEESKKLLTEWGVDVVDFPEDLADIEFKYYANRDANGKNALLGMIDRVQAEIDRLEKANVGNISILELKAITKKLVEEYYGAAIAEVNSCVENVAGMYFRRIAAEDFTEFLEEKGLKVQRVEKEIVDADGVEDDAAPIILAVRDEQLNENVVYTLKKQAAQDGPEKAVIEYDLVSGDGYYRNLIEEFSGESDISLGGSVSCCQGTEGKVSGRVEEEVKKAFEKITVAEN